MSGSTTTPETVQETLDELQALHAGFLAVLAGLDEARASYRAEGDEWSLKERLGHLVDCAENYRQRFVRAQLDEILAFPDYDSAAWVRVQGYQDCPLADLVALWTGVNRLVLHVVARIPAGDWATPCLIGHDKPRTLVAVLQDYAKHQRRHMRKFEGAPPG